MHTLIRSLLLLTRVWWDVTVWGWELTGERR